MSFQRAQEVIDWVHSFVPLGVRPGLERMEWLMARLKHPERRLKFVHIGGTNGKGSTLAFMRHVLTKAGYNVGSFTSPYLTRFQDRIQLNGVDISDGALVKAASTLKPLVDELAETELGPPTEFEVVTALALLYFAQEAYPDLVLWEVGLGGRLDSTNIVHPILTVITNIGHDHMNLLGESLGEIAKEKAGIIKAGVPLVTAVEEGEALDVITQVAKEKKASIYRLGDAFKLEIEQQDGQGSTFSYISWFNRFDRLRIRLKGRHQVYNAGLALMGLEILKQYFALVWEEEELRQGLEEAKWAGRLEEIDPRGPVVLDGAHNPEGIRALVQALKDHYPEKRWTVLFGVLKEKPVLDMLKAFEDAPINQVILTQFEASPRASTVQEMEEALKRVNWQPPFPIWTEQDWEKAYLKAVQGGEPVCFTGSLYFIAEVRRKLFTGI